MSKYKHPTPDTQPVSALTRLQLLALCASLKLPASPEHPTKAMLFALKRADIAYVQRVNGELQALKPDYQPWSPA